MKGGYLKLYRDLINWEWYDHLPTRVLFLHLLMRVNFVDGEWQGVRVKKGQLITGRKVLSKETGLTEQEVRTALSNLQSTSELTIKSTNRYSIIELNNWNHYQQSNQPANQQSTTSKEIKKKRKDKDISKDISKNPTNSEREIKKKPSKKKYGEYKNVLLTEDEYEKLKKKFPDYLAKIKNMDESVEMKGYKYKSHYLAILKWSKDEKPDSKKDETPEEKTPTQLKLEKWLGGFQEISSPETYASSIVRKYPIDVIERSLKDSNCISTFKFYEIAKYHLKNAKK